MADHILQLVLLDLDGRAGLQRIDLRIFRRIHHRQGTPVLHAADRGRTVILLRDRNHALRHLADHFRKDPAGQDDLALFLNGSSVRILNGQGTVGAGHQHPVVLSGNQYAFEDLFGRTGRQGPGNGVQAFEQVLGVHG